MHEYTTSESHTDWVKSAAKPHCGRQIGRQEVTLQHQKMEIPLCAFSRHIWANTSSGSLTLKSTQMLQDARARSCGEEELRSVLRKLIIHRERLCSAAQAPVPTAANVKSQEAPRSPSMMWRADYMAMWGYVVCVCPSTPFLSLFCVHSTGYSSHTFFPYEGILES